MYVYPEARTISIHQGHKYLINLKYQILQIFTIQPQLLGPSTLQPLAPAFNTDIKIYRFLPFLPLCSLPNDKVLTTWWLGYLPHGLLNTSLINTLTQHYIFCLFSRTDVDLPVAYRPKTLWFALCFPKCIALIFFKNLILFFWVSDPKQFLLSQASVCCSTFLVSVLQINVPSRLFTALPDF